MSTDPRKEYDALVAEMTATSPAVSSKMFGMPCLKNSVGKAFAGYYDGAMVFKLEGASHAAALALSNAYPFDPMGGRPMKEWIVVPAEHSARWLEFTQEAMSYIDKLSRK